MIFQEDDPVSQHWRKASRGGLYNDFGYGVVRAHRHLNPDGRLGGWVADTAFVSENACVEDGAYVYDEAAIHGNAWLLPGSVVRERASLRGPVILGRRVVFENYARCHVPAQVRHPVYIGYSPMLSPLSIYEHGKIISDNLPSCSEIICREHPIVIHWKEKGRLNRVIYTDDRVIHDQVFRGYDLVETFRDDLKTAFTPRGESLRSWLPRSHFVSVYNSHNVKGRFPVLKEGEIVWPDCPVRRIRRMPTTVGDPKFYMSH